MIVLRFLAILVYCKKYSKYDLIESVTLPIASFLKKIYFSFKLEFCLYTLVTLFGVHIFSCSL